MIYHQRNKNGKLGEPAGANVFPICANSWPKRHLYTVRLGFVREYIGHFDANYMHFHVLVFQGKKYIRANSYIFCVSVYPTHHKILPLS